ncbi:MAG: tetratricopeptide repeat protein, partial [Deltaproteobacteria bacterium]|nr:tetratricopeptide repeat protein [Deltaproteobacteria bacterium]
MAKKQISKKRKKQLKEPDEFITFFSKILNLVLENKNQAIFIVSVFLFIILMLIGIKSYFVKSENRAFTDMSQSMAEYRALEKASKNNTILQKVDNDLNKILDKYSAMNAKKFAKVDLANISFQSKKFDRAIELYIDAVNDFSDAPSIKNLILNSLACSYEEKNDYKSAAPYFELIVSG